MEYQEQSLGGQIFSRIRDDILSGNYTPGEELKEATLGKQLGVSRYRCGNGTIFHSCIYLHVDKKGR